MKKFLLLNFFCLLVFGAMANELFECTPSEFLDNRSFETGATHDAYGATDWAPFGDVFSLDQNVIGTAQDGEFYLKMFGGNTGIFQDHAITPGDNLTASVYVQNASFDPMLPGCTGFIKLEYFNAGGGNIGVTESTKLDNTLPPDTWTQITLNDVVPAGAAKVRMVVIMQGPNGGAVMFDNASLIGCPPAEPATAPVTFCVDLECFPVSNGVAVAFGFNSFAPINALSDTDGDRTYCGTFDMPVGELEYKFFFSQQQFENLAGAGDCVNENNNRTLTVVEGPPQTVLFGWESCEDNCPAPPMADITFCVNLDCFPQTNGVAVVGSFNGFNPAINPLSDQNGDGTFCGTVAVPVGEQEFKFFFSQQQFENLAGAGDCLNGNNNRTIMVVENDPQTVTFGWGSCDENCVPVSSPVEFCVDMTCYDGEFTNVFVTGGVLDGWCGGCLPLVDPEGDNIYCGTYEVPFGNVEYKFNVDAWSDQEFFTGNEECTTPPAQFINRFFVHSPEVTTQYFGWEICTPSDEEKPSISCPGNYEVFTDQYTCLADIDLLAAEAMDPCLEVVEGRVRLVDPETLANIGPWLSPWSTSVSEALAVGTYRVRWRALDRAGNKKACNYFVTVSEELPCPFTTEDDGIGCINGSEVSFEDGTFTLSSTNCSNPISSNSDQFAYVQQALCGDGTITAQVTSISGNAGGWAGVIMRESNNPSAKSVAFSTSLSASHRREARITTGGTAISQLMPSFNRHWLRLQRVGNQVRAYSSSNGLSWFLRFAQTIPMNQCIEVGLVLNSAVGSGDMTATFDNVVVTGGGYTPTFNANLDGTDALVESSRNFTAYPNPSSGAVTLALGDFLDQEATIEVVNTFGQVVFQRQLGMIDHATEELDLSNLPAGVYILRMDVADGETEMIQIVKQ